MLFRSGPNYRDLYPEPPPPGLVPSCAEGGVLGILPGIIGVIQATETVKILLGVGTTLSGRLLLYDALNMSFRELKLRNFVNVYLNDEDVRTLPQGDSTPVGEQAVISIVPAIAGGL